MAHDPIKQLLQPLFRDEDSFRHWVHSMRSMTSSQSFCTLIRACGTIEEAQAWLQQASKSLPRESKDILRFNLYRRAEDGSRKRTSISLDQELWGAVCNLLGGSDKAHAWLHACAAEIGQSNSSGFSRAIQAAMVRLLAHPQEDKPHP